MKHDRNAFDINGLSKQLFFVEEHCCRNCRCKERVLAKTFILLHLGHSKFNIDGHYNHICQCGFIKTKLYILF